MKLHIAILFLGAFVFASCKMSTSPNSTGGTVPTTANTMYITVGGVTDTLFVTGVDTTYDGIKAIAVGGAGGAGGVASGVTASIALANITTAGSYKVGTLSLNGISPFYVVMEYSTTDKNGTTSTYTSPTSPSLTTASVGNVTIDTITNSSIQATFNGTLTLQNGTATVTITNGGVNAMIH
jgi:hypothetical protein